MHELSIAESIASIAARHADGRRVRRVRRRNQRVELGREPRAAHLRRPKLDECPVVADDRAEAGEHAVEERRRVVGQRVRPAVAERGQHDQPHPHGHA